MYIITFTNNSTYKGGVDITDTGWNSMPALDIYSIENILPGSKLLLRGSDSYNYLIENTVTFGRNNPTAVLLMSRRGDMVDVFRYDLQNQAVTKEIKPFGKEYKNGPTTGWKCGGICK